MVVVFNQKSNGGKKQPVDNDSGMFIIQTVGTRSILTIRTHYINE